jgi:osmotically-inducible protein OsmY
MNRSLLLIGAALAVGACQQSSDRSSEDGVKTPAPSASASAPSGSLNGSPTSTTLANRPGTSAAAPLNSPASAADEHAADNTGKNERDRSGSTATSGDQGGSEGDRKITQQIRQAVVDDSQLSTLAKNVKIITNEGAVTLRGPVKSSEERAQIAAVAQRVAGVKRVDNQLEVATK